MSDTIGINGTTGFFTEGGFGNSALEARGNEAIPSTFGEAVSSQFGQAFSENFGSRLARYAWRNMSSDVLELQPDALNQRFGIPGKLTFDRPMTEGVARDIYEHHRASVLREDAIRRRGDAVGAGTAMSIATGLVAGLLDPLNIAASFIPGVGEANWARILGAGAVRGVGGRALVRGLEGATGGLIGGLATEPFNMALARHDYEDYTMGQFMANIAVGTVLGGAINTGAGMLRDRRGLPPWSPEMHEAARTQGVAAMLQNQPVMAAQAMDFVAGRQGAQDLRKWYEAQAQKERELDDAFATASRREDVNRAATSRLAELNQDASRTRLDLEDINARLRDHGIDSNTSDRLDAIEAELARTIPAARRRALESERTMLTEGANPEAELELARTQAQATGTSALLRRQEASARLAQANANRAAATLRAAESVLEQKGAALASRQSVVSDLMTRTLRTVAWKTGVDMTDADMAGAVRRIMRASPQEADSVIAREIKVITDQAPKMGPFKPGGIQFTGPTRFATMDAVSETLARNAQRGGDELSSRARGDTPDPMLRTSPENDAAVARAPKAEGIDIEKDLAGIEKQSADLRQALDAEQRAREDRAKREGREPPARDRALDEVDEIKAEGDALAKAAMSAAICQIER